MIRIQEQPSGMLMSGFLQMMIRIQEQPWGILINTALKINFQHEGNIPATRNGDQEPKMVLTVMKPTMTVKI